MRVAFACNDPHNGIFTGEFESVDISDDDGELVIELWGPATLLAWSSWHRLVTVAGVGYQVTGYNSWEGNWCWDACTMKRDDVLRLVKQLLELHFDPVEWTTEGPFARLVEDNRR